MNRPREQRSSRRGGDARREQHARKGRDDRHAVDEQWPRHWASGKWRGPTHRLKAFDNERFGQELSELHHLELVVPVGAEASRRLPTPGAASQGKRRSWNRVSDRHPLLHRSSSSRSGGSLGASGRWSVETA